MNNKQLDVQVLPAFHLILDECRVVLKRGSPTPVGLRVSDSRQASAALHNSPFHQSMDVLNRDRAACVLCILKENIMLLPELGVTSSICQCPASYLSHVVVY